jgi:hypothetical protein
LEFSFGSLVEFSEWAFNGSHYTLRPRWLPPSA